MIGSLGYLLHHLESDICPPEPTAWESVLLARALEDITDAVLTQVLPLAVGLLEVSFEVGNIYFILLSITSFLLFFRIKKQN